MTTNSLILKLYSAIKSKDFAEAKEILAILEERVEDTVAGE